MPDYFFGENPSDTQPQTSSLRGAEGYFTVPTQWGVWTDSDRQVWASPNGVNGEPRYACTTDQDFSLKYYDCLANARLQTG